MVKRWWLGMLVGLLLLGAPAQAGNGRIVGGSAADPGEYPHQAFVIVEFDGARSYCGGSLISGRYVVTAAHCMAGPNGSAPDAVTIVLGHDQIPWGTGPIDETDFPPASRYPATIARHEAYDPEQRPNFDVAVARLDRLAPFEQLRFPLPEHTARWSPGVTGTAIGWGVTESGQPSETLQEVQLPVISDADCTSAWASEGPGLIDAPRMLCAAGDQGRDACVGDSGGPLIVPDGAGRMIAGLVSFGSNPCATGLPGVYTELGDPDLNRWVRDRVALAEIASSAEDPEPGQQLTFTASGATPDGPFDAFAWDVDGDGFDDGTGPVLRRAFDRGPLTVSVKATKGGLATHEAVRRRSFDVRFRSPVAFGATAVTVREGDVALLPVVKQGRGAGTVVVTPVSGAGDLIMGPGTLNFAGEVTSGSFALPTLQDALDEPDETFEAELRAPGGDLLLGAATRIAVTVLDDDVTRPGLRHRRVTRLAASFSTVAPARVEVQVLQRGTRRVLAAARARNVAAGSHRASLKLTSTGRRTLRARRRVKVTVRYSATVTGVATPFVTRANATLISGGGR